MIKRLLIASVVFAGLRAQAQIPVTDAGTFAQMVQQVVTAGKQLTDLDNQYKQMVTNAQALGNLQTLMNAYGLSPDQLTQAQMTNLLKQVYTLSSTDPNFSTNLQSSLAAQGYTLPQSNSAISSTAGALYDPNYATTYTNQYNANSRDFNNYSQGVQLMSDVQNQMATNAQNLNGNQVSAVSGLTDNSEGASLHTLAAGQVIQSQQQDTETRLLLIQADAALQQQLDKVNANTATSNEQMQIDQSRQKRVTVSTPTTTANPITQ